MSESLNELLLMYMNLNQRTNLQFIIYRTLSNFYARRHKRQSSRKALVDEICDTTYSKSSTPFRYPA